MRPLSRLCFMAVMDSGDRERDNLLWWSLLFFPFWNPCFISPQTLSLPLPVSVSRGERRAVYLFYMNSPSYIMLYQFPLISTHFLCPLSYSHSFPRPTLHLFLFSSDVNWIYLSAAVKLWKWGVSLVVLCCLLSHRGVCELRQGDICVYVVAGVITACRMKAGHVKTAALFWVCPCVSIYLNHIGV